MRRPVPIKPFLILAITAALSIGIAGAEHSAGEYQVKAAYLMNFARFVEWPAARLPESAPLQIAVVGDDPFGVMLDDTLRGKTANGHPIQLRRLRRSDVLTSAHIVFISASEEAHLPEILQQLNHSSVLTVSDIERFSLRGGAIEFCMVGDRVRFDINRAPAIAGQLSISSRLLTVARVVREGGAQ